jgi:phosphatidylinositol-3,4,5-trisphosphate 3-phosphatase/dual-specificity protein phosphatase PTEN
MGRACASIAQYDDTYVEELKSRVGTGEGVSGSVIWGGVGGDGKHDTTKMFRTCASLPENVRVRVRSLTKLMSQEYNVHNLIRQVAEGSTSLILDRTREFRMRFRLASVPLGWATLIPAFHLPEPLPSTSTPPIKRIYTLHFPRSQIDFAIGPGAAIHQILA